MDLFVFYGASNARNRLAISLSVQFPRPFETGFWAIPSIKTWQHSMKILDFQFKPVWIYRSFYGASTKSKPFGDISSVQFLDYSKRVFCQYNPV